MDYWRQVRQCFGTERFLLTSAAGGIIRDETILLVKHRALGVWQIPGGLQEVGESIQQTVEREIREELALTMQVDALVAVYSGIEWNIDYPDGGKIQQVLFFFAMRGPISAITPQQEEIEAMHFFPFKQLPENMMPCCRQKVQDLQKFTGKTLLR